MYAIGTFLGFLLVQLPVIAVLIAGLVLLSSPRRRLPGRSGLLAKAGLAVLAAQTLASLTWNVVFTQLIGRSTFSVAEFGLLNGIVGFMLAVLFAAGLGLLVGALVSVRSSVAATTADG